jgi:cellulose synthase/poly-beta-1,6-N-acetylglucosamine synthase-like glycosyltransferase
MGLVAIFFFVVYFVALSFITLFCLLQFQLYRGSKTPYLSLSKNAAPDPNQPLPDLEEWPRVCVQLPIYNERFVLERLLEAVVAMEYPLEKLEIQVLDDSDDQTTELAAEKVTLYQSQGFQIQHIRRGERKGFKAGALAHGMSLSEAPFFAIFDADFIPPPDFLKKCLPLLWQDEGLALVQAKWDHLNEDHSLLTRLQALQLNIHFGVEQPGRMGKNLFLQFNGTAGVWRRKAIEEAGNWTSDTLTEDLDLSYRVQLKGWRLHFMKELKAPAELPVAMQSYKSQQFRWMKGGAETAKKILPLLWRSEESFDRKIHGSVHLLGSSTFLLIFLASLASVPSLLLEPYFSIKEYYLWVFLLGTLAFATVFTMANGSLWKLLYFPLYLSVFMGMSLHNARAVWQGWRGKVTPFVRTPKFNLTGRQSLGRIHTYRSGGWQWATAMEGLLAIYFAWGMLYGLKNEQYVFVLYHLLLAVGFAMVFWWSLPQDGVLQKALFVLGMMGLMAGMMVWADRSDMRLFFWLFAFAAGGSLWGAGQIKSLWGLMLATILLRLPVFFCDFPLSEDYLRFYFDAALWALGENPYLIVPEQWSAGAGDLLTGPLAIAWEGMNSASYPTVYPPISQYFFYAMFKLSMGSLDGFAAFSRFFFLLADLGMVYLLWKGMVGERTRPWAAGFYALHPLVIVEGVGHLHTEILAMLLLALALQLRGQRTWASLGFWALSIGVKLLPLLAFPLVLKGKTFWQQALGGLGVLALVGLTFAPFLESGMGMHFLSSLDLYFRRFEFNASLYYIFRWPLQLHLGYNPIAWLGPGMGILTALGIALVGNPWFGKKLSLSAADQFAWIIGIYFLMATTVHPWYMLWGILACILSSSAAGYGLGLWSFAVVASYGFYSNYEQVGPWWWIQYGGLVLGLVFYLKSKPSLPPVGEP